MYTAFHLIQVSSIKWIHHKNIRVDHPERHPQELVMLAHRHKSSFVDIWGPPTHLVITLGQVELREVLVFSHTKERLGWRRNWLRVSDCNLVETTEINADTITPVLLLHNDYRHSSVLSLGPLSAVALSWVKTSGGMVQRLTYRYVRSQVDPVLSQISVAWTIWEYLAEPLDRPSTVAPDFGHSSGPYRSWHLQHLPSVPKYQFRVDLRRLVHHRSNCLDHYLPRSRSPRPWPHTRNVEIISSLARNIEYSWTSFIAQRFLTYITRAAVSGHVLVYARPVEVTHYLLPGLLYSKVTSEGPYHGLMTSRTSSNFLGEQHVVC